MILIFRHGFCLLHYSLFIHMTPAFVCHIYCYDIQTVWKYVSTCIIVHIHYQTSILTNQCLTQNTRPRISSWQSDQSVVLPFSCYIRGHRGCLRCCLVFHGITCIKCHQSIETWRVGYVYYTMPKFTTTISVRNMFSPFSQPIPSMECPICYTISRVESFYLVRFWLAIMSFLSNL